MPVAYVVAIITVLGGLNYELCYQVSQVLQDQSRRG